MTLSASIPLSGYYLDIKSFYVDSYGLETIDAYTSDWRLLGYLPEQYVNNIQTPINFIPSTRFYTSIDVPIPLHRNSLVSASLSFNVASDIPPSYIVEDDLLRTINDWRQPILDKFNGHSNIPISLGVQSGQYIPINSLAGITDSLKSSTTHTIGANQTHYLSTTSFLQYHTQKVAWKKNDRVVFFLSGLPNATGAGGAINVFTLALNLVWNPVPPFAPSVTSIGETAYRQVTLNWNPPTDDGDAPIIQYIVQYGILSGNNNYIDTWYNAGSTSNTTYDIKNLLVDNRYTFRVAAQNSAGVGIFSSQTQPLIISKNLAPVTTLSFNDANYTRIRLRRATASEWSGVNPVLALGEAGYELDGKKLKVGDGLTMWNALEYVKVDNNSINFPSPPATNLYIASSKFNLPNNDRMILNLSSGDRLNIVGENGVTVSYNDTYNSIIVSSDTLYSPITSGTIISPTSSGTVGTLLYDSTWMYFCIQNNYWQRTPIDKTWLDIASTTTSNLSGLYASSTSVIFDQDNINWQSDGDPYPAKAGRPLVNDGINSRSGFGENSTIRDQNYNFTFKYRGGQNSENSQIINHQSVHGIMNNGVIVLSVSAGSGALPGFINAPNGFTFNAVSNSAFFGVDDCGGHPDVNGIYRYRDGRFLKSCWYTDKLYNSNTYYGSSSYSGDYFRHSDGHSKLLGFCLDGYPIYGPYAYSNPNDNTSNVILMTSSYSGLVLDDHRPVNWKYWNTVTVQDIEYAVPMGTFLEDYVYSSGYGTLDQYNGRFGVTPDFPSGTYAYYLTFSDNNLNIPAYPYIFGTGTKQQRTTYSV